MAPPALVIGTAGWSISAGDAEHFGAAGTALQRYASRFAGVEINSSFHRPHRRSTWQRWAESVPEISGSRSRFPRRSPISASWPIARSSSAPSSTKLAGSATSSPSSSFSSPPKLAFDADLIEDFLDNVLPLISAQLVCEPRHPSWFEDAPDALLDRRRVARVAADPACVPAAALPGGWRGLAYWRLHGSPRMYRSSYDDGRLDAYAALLRDDRRAGRPAWCMFDNTAASAATGDALALMSRL